MKTIAVTQRIIDDKITAERRDCLDQRWFGFFEQCQLLPVLIPNHLPTVCRIFDGTAIDGILLTGGGDLLAYGGQDRERDEVEKFLIDYGLAKKLPLGGVCRGMQAIQHYFGVALCQVEGHVCPSQEILISGHKEQVNSYHRLGSREGVPCLEAWAQSNDGVIKAVRHRSEKVFGMMWHPERLTPFRDQDIQIFKDFFSVDDRAFRRVG